MTIVMTLTIPFSKYTGAKNRGKFSTYIRQMPGVACLLWFILLGIMPDTAKAQGNPKTLIPSPAKLKVDGSLKEWGDSLSYYNDATNLHFNVASDGDKLYVALLFDDRLQQIRVLNSGVTLGINTKGKKKEAYSLTFPLVEGMNGLNGFRKRPEDDNSITQEDRDELLKAMLTKLRWIKITGFKDIESDVITTTNTYGIEAALNYDADGRLAYEMAIPLKFFHEDSPAKNEWAFNFKINGLAKPAAGEGPENGNKRGGGMGGRGGGMRGGGGGMGGGGGGKRGGGMGGRGNKDMAAGGSDRGELFKSTDFWQKLKVSY